MTTLKLGSKSVTGKPVNLRSEILDVETGTSRAPLHQWALLLDSKKYIRAKILTFDCSSQLWTVIKETTPGIHIDRNGKARTRRSLHIAGFDAQGKITQTATNQLMAELAAHAGFADPQGLTKWMNENFGTFVIEVPRDDFLARVGKTKSFSVEIICEHLAYWLSFPSQKTQGSLLLLVPYSYYFKLTPYFNCTTGKQIPSALTRSVLMPSGHLTPKDKTVRKLLLPVLRVESGVARKRLDDIRQDIEGAEARLREDPHDVVARELLEEAKAKLDDAKEDWRGWSERVEKEATGN
ncbi:MAG: hypothetical protein AAFN94_04405 [Pseudomonadota bacterium]